jgi:hypothetical protein
MDANGCALGSLCLLAFFAAIPPSGKTSRGLKDWRTPNPGGATERQKTLRVLECGSPLSSLHGIFTPLASVTKPPRRFCPRSQPLPPAVVPD